MEVISNSSLKNMQTALGALNSDSKQHLQDFLVKGVYYQEYQIEDPGMKGRMIPRVGTELPSQPAYTTWSGLMRCSPNSEYAARLIEKCGGVPIGEDEKEFTEAHARKAAGVGNARSDAETKIKESVVEKISENKILNEENTEEVVAWWKSIKADDEKKMKEEAEKEKTRWWRSANAVIGYWTAPEYWPEMLAGNEPSTPCSTKDYPKQSFQPSWT